MADTPSHVQVAPDSTGKLIDAQSLTTPEDGVSTVQRQTVTIGDPENYSNLQQIDVMGMSFIRVEHLQGVMEDLLKEIKLLRLAVSQIGDVHLEEEAIEWP